MSSFGTSNINLLQFYNPLERASDLDSLMDRIGDSKYVLPGETIGIFWIISDYKERKNTSKYNNEIFNK